MQNNDYTRPSAEWMRWYDQDMERIGGVVVLMLAVSKQSGIGLQRGVPGLWALLGLWPRYHRPEDAKVATARRSEGS